MTIEQSPEVKRLIEDAAEAVEKVDADELERFADSMRMTIVEASVKVPRVWKDLIQVEFPEDLDGVLDEKTDHTGNADPKAHYDDQRTIAGVFPNGHTFVLALLSGQSNYFGGLSIGWPGDGWDSEPFEAFDDVEEVEIDRDGKKIKYVLRIEWTEGP